jgi:hypothetical protein
MAQWLRHYSSYRGYLGSQATVEARKYCSDKGTLLLLTTVSSVEQQVAKEEIKIFLQRYCRVFAGRLLLFFPVKAPAEYLVIARCVALFGFRPSLVGRNGERRSQRVVYELSTIKGYLPPKK